MSIATPPDMVVKNRFLGFLIWQSIPSTAIFLLSNTFVVSLFASDAISPILRLLSTFFTFHLSQLIFSASLSVVSSPQPTPPASPIQLLFGLVRLLLGDSTDLSIDFRRRAKVSLSFVLFVAASAFSGLVSVVPFFWVSGVDADGLLMIRRVGIRGFVAGLLYGLFYIYKKRWVLEFPIIQRPPFFSFKMGLPSALQRALQLSATASVFSAMLVIFLPQQFKGQVTVGNFITEQIIFYIGCFSVFLCWELSHHLHQVLCTKRFIFAPPKGSAAAETNPSEPLLAALEESFPGSLLKYLAYLDLSMVCENNVDIWRRAALFEETSETYKRVVTLCLRPLEQLAFKLSESLEGFSAEKSFQSSNPVQANDPRLDSNCSEPMNNFQLCAWCAQSVASLTARSHREDRFGVAQLSGRNAAVISALLSCLLAVEAFMGKKTSLQPPHHLMGMGGIRWATTSTGRRDVRTAKRKGSLQYSKAFAMADVLRTSIYGIVSAFHKEMLRSAKTGDLEKDWIDSGKPVFGTRELLVQKLHLFLDFRA
ncbi:hypothetical protein SLE2022_347340 [Rubroshorea leprosula]